MQFFDTRLRLINFDIFYLFYKKKNTGAEMGRYVISCTCGCRLFDLAEKLGERNLDC